MVVTLTLDFLQKSPNSEVSFVHRSTAQSKVEARFLRCIKCCLDIRNDWATMDAECGMQKWAAVRSRVEFQTTNASLIARLIGLKI
jgi:hypothetical protein